MNTIPLLVRLPEELVRRFRRTVATRQRSKFIRQLLEDNLPVDDGDNEDPLYKIAVAVEADGGLASEMDEWEAATLADGLWDTDVDRNVKRSRGE